MLSVKPGDAVNGEVQVHLPRDCNLGPPPHSRVARLLKASAGSPLGRNSAGLSGTFGSDLPGRGVLSPARERRFKSWQIQPGKLASRLAVEDGLTQVRNGHTNSHELMAALVVGRRGTGGERSDCEVADGKACVRLAARVTSRAEWHPLPARTRPPKIGGTSSRFSFSNSVIR